MALGVVVGQPGGNGRGRGVEREQGLAAVGVEDLHVLPVEQQREAVGGGGPRDAARIREAVRGLDRARPESYAATPVPLRPTTSLAAAFHSMVWRSGIASSSNSKRQSPCAISNMAPVSVKSSSPTQT